MPENLRMCKFYSNFAVGFKQTIYNILSNSFGVLKG